MLQPIYWGAQHYDRSWGYKDDMKKAVIFDYYGVLINHGALDPLLVAEIRELKKSGLKLFIISNADQEQAAEHTSEFPERDLLFDKCYYSSETGFKKPDPRGYELILKENNLAPGEVVYFDDNSQHVATAQSLGIESYVYVGPEQVREKVRLV